MTGRTDDAIALHYVCKAYGLDPYLLWANGTVEQLTFNAAVALIGADDEKARMEEAREEAERKARMGL